MKYYHSNKIAFLFTIIFAASTIIVADGKFGKRRYRRRRLKCGNGRERDDKANKCVTCPKDTYRSQKQTKCIPCPSGLSTFGVTVQCVRKRVELVLKWNLMKLRTQALVQQII